MHSMNGEGVWQIIRTVFNVHIYLFTAVYDLYIAEFKRHDVNPRDTR